jgi:hypothetical protein
METLARIEERCRSGAADWQGETEPLPAPLAAVIDGAWRSGLPLAESLAAFRAVLGHAQAGRRSDRELRVLLLTRAATAIGVAAAARYGLGLLDLGGGGAQPDPALDRGALLLAFALAAVSLWTLDRLLPGTWLLARAEGALTAEALAWLGSHLSGDEMGGPIDADLREASRRELESGVGLLGEKRRLLWRHADGEAEAAARRRARLADLMPLFELLGAGLPAALILLAPAVAALGS